MRVRAVRLRDFRNYERAEAELGEGLSVVTGPNGAGKTNLLEGLHMGCTGRSPRTANEREVVRRGAALARVELDTQDDDGPHAIELALEPGEPKRTRVDGAAVESLQALERRPLASIFLPERLELVKGAPALRRAHLDQVVAALWPSRREVRSAYSRALAQRNALLGRIRAGAAGDDGLDAWDAELARQGVSLMEHRREAIELLRPRFAERARGLGLRETAELRYRPRSRALDPEALCGELAERRRADLERGFTAHGPHRDEVQLLMGDEALRSYGSQGQQRVALLALLVAERDVLIAERGRAPLMLLDDVMSELDAERRGLLAELLRSSGQAVVTATEADSVPGALDSGVTLVRVEDGAVLGRPVSAAA